MNFAALNSAVNDLRNGLCAQVSDNALLSVKSRPPAGNNDEASFLRLTTWCYILIFEAGRVGIRYLLKVPPPLGDLARSESANKICNNVNLLRTWFFHNLDFEDTKRKEVSNWFLAQCKVISPTEKKHWKACIKGLCKEGTELIVYCNEVLSKIAASEEDKEIFFEDLINRIERNWPAYEFDKLVSNAASHIGENLDVVKFRNIKLSTWRQYLEQQPEDADLRREATRIIERDVHDHFRSILPVTTQEIMTVLGLDPGPEVRDAIELSRSLFNDGVRDPETLLEQLKSKYS
ncbi:hypothetical protein SAMN02746065_103116 [Desulfocicer vacuolatum DSM 3385]|uniref:Uncharacterized protein n=1 Tax=Desulfocicer vacuolatum DSM 3385 TaxID=1121400 RepID=A0A1W1ZQY0_9BACT|nr:hypothetical protein [Desulfocicer vacuolatum]SMC50945.1 hypothetical protein SAMN02746065_103116 [Desulfocicer vacuolatum DSM 3385]